MKTLSILFINISFLAVISSQTCLPNGIIFEKQNEIDSFPINFPGWQLIHGPVTIQGDGITNLEALSNIISIQGNLLIQNTAALTSLHGLHNLTDIGGGIRILDNQLLSDLSAFSLLDTINGDLWIVANTQLQDMVGFENVTKIKDSIRIANNPQLSSLNLNLKSGVSQITIINNSRLKHLYGFEDITFQTGGIKILYNDSLQDFHGFDNLSILRSDLFIDGNPMAIDFSGFNKLKEVGGLIITNMPCKNLTGFSSLERIRGNFEIGLTDNMESFQGVPVLQKIDEIFNIYKAGRFKTFDGLNQLEEVRKLWIEKNDSIVSLQGLNGLKTIGTFLKIKDNPLLQDLSALLGAIGLDDQILISGNENLQSLYGLDNLCISPIVQYIIEDNPNLSICNNPCLCTHLLQGGPNSINGNSPGCNTSTEIIASCTVSNQDPDLPELHVRPNPANQFIEITGLNGFPFDFTIIDMLGNNIQKGSSDLSHINIQKLPIGIYMIVINDGEIMVSDRFVKN